MSELLSALRRVLLRLGLWRRPEAELLPVLLRAVRADVPDVSAEDLMDAIWLLLHTSTAQPTPRRSLWLWRRPARQRPALALPASSEAADAPSPAASVPRPLPGDAAAGLYLGGSRGPRGGLPFRTPAAPALPAKLALLRALRPLRRRVPSRVRVKLAERDTVEAIARTGTWEPCMVPETERWLRVALVVDRGESMALWTQTARELAQLLQRYGVFSNVRILSLETQGAPHLFTGLGPRTGRGPRPMALLEPAGYSVVLVLSDCVSPAWHDGSMAACLERWGQRAPVALIQVLPAALWPRTALGRAAPVWLQAAAPAAPSGKLAVRFQHRWMRFPAPYRAVPVMTLEISSLRAWARMIAGAGGAWVPGVALGCLGQVGAGRPLGGRAAKPKEQVQRFQLAATEPAWELARLLAAVPPFNLSVLRLVRQSLVPRARQVHEAEVLLGGLLAVQQDAQDPEDVRYDYPPGLREILLGELRPTEIAGVLGTVSEYITRNLGAVQDFQAILARPHEFLGADLLDQSPFARVTASVLARLGGPYAALAGIPEVASKLGVEEKPGLAQQRRLKRIFIAYAAPDMAYFRALQSHLEPLVRARGLELLHEGNLEVGSDRNKEVSRMIDTANILLILLSPDLLASHHFVNWELPMIRDSYERGGADVLLIRVRSMAHVDELFPGFSPAQLDATDGRYPDRDRAWIEIVRELDKVLLNPGMTRRSRRVEPTRRKHQAPKIYLSYAHEDQGLARGFESHLTVLRHQGIISEWFSLAVGPDENSPQEIENLLNQADMILFLISADFLASAYHEAEVRRALERQRNDEAMVISIIVRPVDWRASQLGQFKILPKNARPVTLWADQDEAWVDVAEELRRSAMGGQQQKSTAPKQPAPSFLERVRTFFTPQAKPVESSSIRPTPVLIISAREDDHLLDELLKHLGPSVSRGLIDVSSIRDLQLGDNPDELFRLQLRLAEIVVFLVSADLLSTENLYIERTLQRASDGQVRVVPVLVRWVAWEHSSFARFQALPNNKKPVVAYADRATGHGPR